MDIRASDISKHRRTLSLHTALRTILVRRRAGGILDTTFQGKRPINLRSPNVTEDFGRRRDDRSDADRPADATCQLLERAKSGDPDALEVLFARHISLLRRWASGRLPRWARDVADTQDLVQDTVFRVFKRVEAFEPRGEGALQAYLRQAVMNRIRNEFRSKARRPELADLDAGVPGDRTSPLEAAIRQEQFDRYDAALSRLSEQERNLIVARVEMGLTYEELAEAQGKPSWNAARMAVARALVRLAEELKRDR
jgi:RNA polymerase sigma-70 factor (ECF subfamily)